MYVQFLFFFFKQKTAYEISACLVGSEMCIRDSLSTDERKAALVLSQAVSLGLKMAEEGETDADKIVSAMKEHIAKEPLAQIDYVKAVDANSIEPVSKMKGDVLVAMAVYIGKTRLIDNFIFKGEEK